MLGLRERIALRFGMCACCEGKLDTLWRTFAGFAVCRQCYRLLAG